MRRVVIDYDNRPYRPGEVVSGKVSVTTDKEFQCNRALISLVGVVRTSVVRGGGRTRRVYRDSLTLVDETCVLSEERSIPEGETSFPFEFRLPTYIPDTFSAYRAEVSYGLSAKVEVSWALDPKAESEVHVSVPLSERRGERQTPRIDTGDGDEVLVDMPSDTLVPGSSVRLRLSVHGSPRIRGVRTELFQVVHRVARGRDDESWVELDRQTVEAEELAAGLWTDVTLGPVPERLVEIKTPLLTVRYILKVTADIPFRFDKSVEIPLAVGLAPSDDLLEADVSSVGWEFRISG